MHHASKVCFQALVETLYLPVCLWMVRGAEVECHVSHFENLAPDCADEDFVTV
jgi:hypothetical protein